MLKNHLLQDLKTHFESLGSVRNLAQKYDHGLLEYLLKGSAYREEFQTRFFIQTSQALIFKLNDFLSFLDLKNLGGSYTSYASKIGLASKMKFLKANNEVVLNFAFKDGVIKGSQSKDQEKQNEIFFHEVLAKDEIDVLFTPKALHHFEFFTDFKFSQTSESHSLDPNSFILKALDSKTSPNLLLKGNNLLALHSLKEKFARKVKLIYIDPPYNTGNDSFNYNDRFNHSTWLTFMKNRLEVAREFLRDDGVIFIQCDDNEQAYLKVLMDEIFGRENFVACLVWERTKTPARLSKNIAKTHEYILIYANNTYSFQLNKIPLNDNYIKKVYKNPDQDHRGLWRLTPLLQPTNSPNKVATYTMPDGRKITGKWRCSEKTFLRYIQENRLIYSENGQPNKKIFLSQSEGQLLNSILDNDGTNEKATNEIKALFADFNNPCAGSTQKSVVGGLGDFKGDKGSDFAIQAPLSPLGEDDESLDIDSKNAEQTPLFSTPKPEALLKRIIEISTNEGDLILDFFAGSGTTLAVAHKMGRRWIGIEQMDYIESITKERLKKVIDGEQGGVSKAVEWKGGGSFIYAELMPLNALYKEKIENSKDEKELEKIYQDLESKAFLDYRVDLQEVLKDREFQTLALEEKKEVLKLILDSNMDYLPYGEIKDCTYEISQETIALNEIFYGGKK